MAIFACKLPNGIAIRHNEKIITLAGANVGETLANVSLNGSPSDNARRAHGYGLTEVSNALVETFNDWAAKVTYKNGNPADGKLAEPFPALDNGSILGPFRTMDEARRECASIAGAVTTGFEGLDPEAEGVETNEEADGKPVTTSRRKK